MKKFWLGSLAGGAVGACIFWLCQGWSLSLHPANMSYADFAAVLLGAAALIVTVFGLFLGILALWGYTQFETIVKGSSRESVEKQLENGKLRTEIAALVSLKAANELAGAREELSIAVLAHVDSELHPQNVACFRAMNRMVPPKSLRVASVITAGLALFRRSERKNADVRYSIPQPPLDAGRHPAALPTDRSDGFAAHAPELTPADRLRTLLAPPLSEPRMDEPPVCLPVTLTPANDGRPADEVTARVDAAVMTLARLLGRQIARDEFDRRQLADPTPLPEDQPRR